MVQVEPESVGQVDHAHAGMPIGAYLIADFVAEPEQHEQSRGCGKHGSWSVHWFLLSRSAPLRYDARVRSWSSLSDASSDRRDCPVMRCSARTRMFVSVCSRVHGGSSAIGCMGMAFPGAWGSPRLGAGWLFPVSAARVMRVRP